MKNATDYPTNTAIALLLAGDTGTGKSTHLLNWPRPWILDLEKNLKGAVEHHRQAKPDLWFGWDTPETDKSGQSLPEEKQFARCKELVMEAVANPDVGTICVDGFVRLCELLKAKLVNETGGIEKALTIGGRKQMTVSLWQPFAQESKDFVWAVKGKKPFIMTAHLKVDENEMSAIKEYKIDVQAELGKSNSYPKLYSDYWQTLTEVMATADKDHPRGVRYKLRTAPTVRNPSLKTSFTNVPAEFEAGDAAFKALLQQVAGVTK